MLPNHSRTGPATPLTASGWNIDASEFPWRGATSDRLRFLLRYALLAPSNHNTQPWRFGLHHDRVELFADRSRSLSAADPFDRELLISCGAALGILRLAAGAFGCRLSIRRFPDPASKDLLASITLPENQENHPAEPDQELLAAILRRRTNRNAFGPAPVTAEQRERLDASLQESDVHAGWIDEDADRAQLVRLVMAADRIQFENAAFLRELAAWIRPPLTSARDGIPAHAVGISGFAAYVAPLLVRTFDLGDGKAARDEELVRRSPGIAVLSTPFDTAHDWLACGEALAAFIIEAERLGLKVSYLNQPCEVSELRFQLSLLDRIKGNPQLILRLGLADATVAPSPRRPLEDFL
jgi:nitroreductase